MDKGLKSSRAQGVQDDHVCLLCGVTILKSLLFATLDSFSCMDKITGRRPTTMTAAAAAFTAREAVPCAVRVLQVAAVTSMAHPKFLELENSRFSADFSFRKKEDFEKSAFQQRICSHRFYCNFSFQTDADKAPCIIIGSNFLRVNVVFACVK